MYILAGFIHSSSDSTLVHMYICTYVRFHFFGWNGRLFCCHSLCKHDTVESDVHRLTRDRRRYKKNSENLNIHELFFRWKLTLPIAPRHVHGFVCIYICSQWPFAKKLKYTLNRDSEALFQLRPGGKLWPPRVNFVPCIGVKLCMVT
jgi:hypothetical protein